MPSFGFGIYFFTDFTKKGAFYAIKIKFISLCDMLSANKTEWSDAMSNTDYSYKIRKKRKGGE